ncbi:MAG: hypothetical protein R3B70_20370 [Polyangiaceae bacterium]
MLYLAMSCLQGRPQMAAYLALARLGADGIQLTPGNHPSPGFKAFLRGSRLSFRVHDGFSWHAYRAPTTRDDGTLVRPDHEGPWSLHPPEMPSPESASPRQGPWSLHPPEMPSPKRLFSSGAGAQPPQRPHVGSPGRAPHRSTPPRNQTAQLDAFLGDVASPEPAPCSSTSPRDLTDQLDSFLGAAASEGAIVETMYSGYLLDTGEALCHAMDRGARLAVDIAHLHLQETAGQLDPGVRRRLEEYDGVAEVHVSANDGRSDAHRPLRADSPGLGWAHARLRAGTPVVLECYMHRLSDDERRRQVDIARGEMA